MGALAASDRGGARTRPILAVIGAAMLFGTAGTAQELGPDAATPLGVGAVRIAIGTLVLWAALWWRRVAVRPTIVRHRRLFVVGGLGVATYTPMFLAAVDRTGVAVGTVVAIGSGPFFAGALEWTWRSVRPSGGWLLGSLITVSGGALLVAAQTVAGTGGESSVDAVGVVFALTAGAGYAMYSVTAKVTMDDGVDPTLALAAPFAVGAIAVCLMAIGQPFGWLTTGSGLLMAVELGVAATGVAYLLYGFGLRRLTSATTVTLVLAEPLTATALAALVLDESVVALGWVGIAVLCAGLLIVGRSADVSFEPVAPAA